MGTVSMIEGCFLFLCAVALVGSLVVLMRYLQKWGSLLIQKRN